MSFCYGDSWYIINVINRNSLNGILMNKKIIYRNCTIALTFIIMVVEVFLYLYIRQNWERLLVSDDPYANASTMIVHIFILGALLYGAGLILGLWLEYIFINLLIKIYNKNDGTRKWLLSAIILIGVVVLAALMLKLAHSLITIILSLF